MDKRGSRKEGTGVVERSISCRSGACQTRMVGQQFEMAARETFGPGPGLAAIESACSAMTAVADDNRKRI